MEKSVHFVVLFDLYGNLLTDKQADIFKLYFEEDYSVNEIADKYSVSKQYVHKTLKVIINKLSEYDNKMKLNKE